MEATTRKQLDAITRQVNEMLDARGSSARLLVEMRNGYCALDEGDADGRTVRHLRAGTKTEIAAAVRMIAQGMWLTEGEYVA